MSTPRPAAFDRFWFVLLLVPPLLLLPSLGSSFLWQDEAETALLAQRVAEHGLPLADDGVGPVISDQEGQRDLNDQGVWIWSPWLDKYVAAAGLAVFGDTALGARLPFALLGWAALALAYAMLRDVTRQRWTSRYALVLLAGSVWFLVYARQCRYYSPLVLASVAHLWGYARMARGARGGGLLFVLGGAGLFQTFYPQLAASTVAMGLHAVWLRRPRLLARFAGACAVVALVSVPFFAYIRGWSRDYEGAGYGFDDLWRYAASLRAYLLFVHAYAWPFLFAIPLVVPIFRRRAALPESFAIVTLSLLGLYGLVAYPSASSLGGLLIAVVGAALFGARCLLSRQRARAEVDEARWPELFGLVIVCTVLLSAGVASFPFFRYLLGVLPLLAFVTAATVRAWVPGDGLASWSLAAALVLGNWLHAVPLELTRRVLLPNTGFDDEQLARATGFGHPPTNGVSARVLALPDTVQTFRFLGAEYAAELTRDYDGPLEGVWRAIDERAEPGEVLVVTYEHFPLMFHTDLDVRRDFELAGLDEPPQWILVHSPRAPRFEPAVWDAVTNGSSMPLGDGRTVRYARVDLDVVELPWENIPEPYWHRFVTEPPGPGRPPPMLYHLETTSE